MKSVQRSWSRVLATGVVALVAVSCAPSPTPTGAPSTGSPSPAAAAPAPTPTSVLATPRPAVAPPTPTPQRIVASPTPTPAPAVARGGVLTMRQHGAFSSLDPLWPGGTSEARMIAPMYSRLLSLDKEDDILPLLAREWAVTGNGAVFTFKLRDDARFHDGKPVTGEDVAYSFNMIINPPKGISSIHKGVFAPVIAKVEALDRLTVRITTKRPVGWFLSHVPLVQIAPRHAHEPKAAEGGFAGTGLGSGPFKFKAHTPGVELRMVRNEDYFRKDLPYLDEVRSVIIVEDQTVIAAFIAGRLQLSGARPISPEAVDAIKALREVSVLTAPRPLYIGVGFNHSHPQLAKKRVREALVLALDSKAITDVAYPGVYDVPGSWFPGRFGIPEKERNQYAIFGYGKPRQERLDTARKILDAEGVRDLRLNVMTYPGTHRTASEVVQELLGRVGVKANLVVTDRAVLFERGIKGDYDLLVPWTGSSPFGEPEHFLGTTFASNAPTAVVGRPAGFSDPRVDELYAKLQNTIELGKRVEITQQIDRVLLEDMPATLFGWGAQRDVLDLRLRGYYPKEVWHPVFMLESVWLAPQ